MIILFSKLYKKKNLYIYNLKLMNNLKEFYLKIFIIGMALTDNLSVNHQNLILLIKNINFFGKI